MRKYITLLAACFLGLTLTAKQRPALPSIPDARINILELGAVADGITLNTEVIQQAIDKLANEGGGHVVIPEGLFLTGPIVLKDCIDLHLDRGAMLLMSPDKSLYLKDGKGRPAITASKRHDVSITGKGTIDGNGAWWRPVKRGKVSDTEWKEFTKKGGKITSDGKLWYPFNLNHYANITKNEKDEEKLRAHLVRFTDSERIMVEGVTIQNSPRFHIVPQRCQDVTIVGVTVRCPWNAQNGDGIDIMNSRRVLIARCIVDVGDDGICLKAGAGEKGVEYGPTSDVTIENNTVYHAHGGFVIGSEFTGGMENITVRHNVFSGTDTGLRFKSAPERGGLTKNIRISDIIMNDIKDYAIVFETSYADRPAGKEKNVAAQTNNFLPEFTDIQMEHIRCRGVATAVCAKGSLEMIHDIVLKDAVFFYEEKAMDVDFPRMIKFENVQFKTY